MDTLTSALSDPVYLKWIGFRLTVLGIAGEILLLFFASKRVALQKALGGFFIFLIITGVWLDDTADLKKIADRMLTGEQQARIADKLRSFGSIPFDFALQTNPETIQLMEQVAAAVEAATWARKEWKYPPGQVGTIFTPFGDKPGVGIVSFRGLQILWDDSRTAEFGAAAVALRDALNAEGVAATARRVTDKSDNPDAVHVEIGKKF